MWGKKNDKVCTFHQGSQSHMGELFKFSWFTSVFKYSMSEWRKSHHIWKKESSHLLIDFPEALVLWTPEHVLHSLLCKDITDVHITNMEFSYFSFSIIFICLPVSWIMYARQNVCFYLIGSMENIQRKETNLGASVWSNEPFVYWCVILILLQELAKIKIISYVKKNWQVKLVIMAHAQYFEFYRLFWFLLTFSVFLRRIGISQQ